MKIEAGHIYQHEECGEVLVLGVHRRYNSYNTEEETGIEDGVYVQYADRWDGYGAMFGATRQDPVEVFIDAVGAELREFDRIENW